MERAKKVATFIEKGIAPADERDEIIDSLSRDQMVSYLDNRHREIARRAQELARDMAKAKGTTYEQELALIQRDVDEAVAAQRNEV